MRSVVVPLFVFMITVVSAFSQGAEACGVCHSAHLKEWKGSPHATSWVSEKFFGQMEKFGSKEFCAGCHAPMSVWSEVNLKKQTDGPADFRQQQVVEEADYTPALRNIPSARAGELEEGVTCGSCHLIQIFSPAGKREDFLGPYHTQEGHGGRQEGAFENLRICGTCHGRSPADYSPGDQVADGFYHANNLPVEFAYGSTDCSSCHMPRQEGKLVQLRAFKDVPLRQVGNHTYIGNRYEKLAEALDFSIVQGDENAALAVTNKGVGHSIRICPETSYRISVAPVKGTKAGKAEYVVLEAAEKLKPGETIPILLPFPIEEGTKLKVELLVSAKGQEEKAVVSKTI